MSKSSLLLGMVALGALLAGYFALRGRHGPAAEPSSPSSTPAVSHAGEPDAPDVALARAADEPAVSTDADGAPGRTKAAGDGREKPAESPESKAPPAKVVYAPADELVMLAVTDPAVFDDKARGWGQAELKANYEAMNEILIAQLAGDLQDGALALKPEQIETLQQQVAWLETRIEN